MKNNRIIFPTIFLALLIISGCLQLVPSVQESQRFMIEQATIMSMANQGQFNEAIAAADSYIDAYLKEEKYFEAMNLLVSKAGFSYQVGNYEKVINSYEEIENVYKQARLKYKGNKSTDYKASDAGTRFATYIGVYIDASIQLGEYDSILVVLNKGEKVLKVSLSEMEDFFQSTQAQMEKNTSNLLRLNSKMNEEIIKNQERAKRQQMSTLKMYEIQFLYYKILALKALGKKEQSIELWNQYKSKYPDDIMTSGELDTYNTKTNIVFNMARSAWLVDDGNYLLNAGIQMKTFKFPKEVEDLRTKPNIPTTLFLGTNFTKNLDKMLSYSENWFILGGIFYEAEGLRLTEKYEQAVNAYLDFLSRPEVSGQGKFLWKAYDGLGKAYEALEKKEKASDAYLEAIQIIESERQFLSKDSYKQNFLLQRNHPYNRAVILLAERDPKKSFYVAEQGKSRALLDLLEGKMVGRTAQALETNDLISKQSRKLHASNTLAGSNVNRMPQPSVQTTRATIQQAKSELEDTDVELLSMINSQAGTYTDFNALMTPDTAIIEYYLTPKEGVIFVGVGQNLHAIKIQIK